MSRFLTVVASFCLSFSLVFAQPAPVHKTKHVIWVMTDGLRWQEVFQGAELAQITKENGVPNADKLKASFWRDTPQARREALMPFLWSTIAHDGQIYGNRELGSDAYVTNGKNFSYPGYNESLTGAADPRIDSNDKKNNPNVTVLEWLNGKPAYHNKVAAFAAWDVFPYIFNATRAGFPVNAGYDPFMAVPGDTRIQLLNELKRTFPREGWEGEPYDNLTFFTALEYLQQRKPSVMYLSLGETDEWAHAGKYAEYLESAHRVDEYLKRLWDTLQSMPEYRGVTTLIFSPDHGRGDGPDWRSHGERLPNSKYIWMAFLGPDTQALGERSHVQPVTQSQIAATLAALLGEDYHQVVPASGAPVADALPHAKTK